MKPAIQRWLLLLFAVIFTAGAAYAQGVTTASIQGIVSDNTGEALPGATVIATHVPTGTEYGTVTDTDGRYDLQNLRPGGPYAIRVSFVGYQNAQESGLTLALGQRLQRNVTLQSGTTELEEVVVVGQSSSVMNQDRTGASTNVGRETIETLPTISRSISDFARLSPQSTGGSSLAGRNNRFNNIQIDGATMNDVFGLSGTGAPGGQAGAQPISLDAIEEFNVDIAPFDVRYSGFTGGSINAITRSGTNDFHGSVRYLGRSDAFQGDLNVNSYDSKTRTWTSSVSKPSDFSEYYLVGNLGGPIIKNKLFFFVNGEFEKENAPIDAGIVGSGAANIFNVPAATMSRIMDIARNKYGYDPGSYDPLSMGRDNKKILAKLDWNINRDHKLTLRHSLIDAIDDDGVTRNTTNFNYGNSIFLRDEVTNSTVAELRSTFGKNAYNQARLVRTSILFKRAVEANPFPNVLIYNVNGPSTTEKVTLGVDRYSQANELDQYLWEFTDDFTLIRGKHNFTLGTSNQLFNFRNVYIRDYYGAYEFNSVADFEAGKPSRYYFSKSRIEGEVKPAAQFKTLMAGVYAQDQFQATPNLTLTAGLRVDAPFFLDKPRYNQLAEDVFGYSTNKVPNGKLLWAPRFGFNWDASNGARTTQVRGGTGIFTGRTPFVWISNQYGNTGMEFTRIDAKNPAITFEPTPDPERQPTLPGSNTSEVDFTDPNFKFPQVWRNNLALDQELPFYNIVATVEGLYSKAINDISYRNLNLVSTKTAPDGRPIYDSKVDRTNFTDAILMENTKEGYEYSLSLGLRRDVAQGLNGSLFYTYNRAENVNNVTSSQAVSNWQYNESADQNNAQLATADFEVRNRILANLSYRFKYLKAFATSVGLFYEGRSGSPFSWIYNGNVNSDPRYDNDAIYVPNSMDEAIWYAPTGDTRTPQQVWDDFDSFVESQPSLRDARGTIVARNAARTPWRNILDLNVTQTVNTVRGQRLELSANLMNVLNLLNPDWGHIKYAYNDNYQVLTFNGYDTNTGKPKLTFDPIKAQNMFEKSFSSRWQLQLGLRYSF